MSDAVRAARAQAAFWAGFLRNRALNESTRRWGAIPVAGGYALAAPGTGFGYAIGVGTARALTAEDLAALTEFYASRGLPPRAEFETAVIERDGALLEAAGFAGDARAAVMVHPLEGALADPGPATLTTDRTRWSAVHAAVLGLDDPPTAHATAHLVAAAARRLFAVPGEDGRFAAIGALGLVGGAAFLFGGATRPEARGRGYHRALIAARLAAARAEGASWAFLVADAGGTVEHTATRLGCVRAGTRTRLTAGVDAAASHGVRWGDG